MKGCQLAGSVMARTLPELLRLRDAQRGVDLVELRLDAMTAPDVPGALVGRIAPTIVTCRPTWEGGHYSGGESERLALLQQALAHGAEFIDVEWRATSAAALCAEHGSRVVLSTHDFDGVPRDLADRVRHMLALGPAIVKVAVTPRSLTELAAAADTVRSVRATNIVFIGMGAIGFASRVLPAKFGSVWSYCGDGVAPGQVPASRLRSEFGFGAVTAEADVYAVVGRPIMHSLSPAMHNAAFRAAGTNAVYVPLEAQDWSDFSTMAAWLGLRGCSVTAPFKQDAFRDVVQMDTEARDVGALNTLRRTPTNQWEGMNSDVHGLLAPLSGELLTGRRVSVLGTGGAARAACVALHRRGARVTVHGRRVEASRRLAEELGVAAGEYPPPRDCWDLLVNTTPIGTWPNVDSSPLPLDGLSDDTSDGPSRVQADGLSNRRSERLVYDLVYNPEETQLLQDARAAGYRTLGGLEMLVAQAEAQWQWWTGEEAPVNVMSAAARARLADRRGEAAPSPLGSVATP